MTKPEFHKPLTWNIGPDGHTLPFTRRQLHLVYCNPHTWATYNHILIGRNKFRIKKRDVRKATLERFLKAIFVSPDPNSNDPDDTIQEDRYGELQQIVRYVGSVDRLYRVAVEVWRRGAERRARCGKADRCAEKLGRGRSLNCTR